MAKVAEMVGTLESYAKESGDPKMVEAVSTVQLQLEGCSSTQEQPALRELILRKKTAEATKAGLLKDGYPEAAEGCQRDVDRLSEQIQKLRMEDPVKAFTSAKTKHDNKLRQVKEARKQKEDREKQLQEAQEALEEEERALAGLKEILDEAERAMRATPCPGESPAPTNGEVGPKVQGQPAAPPESCQPGHTPMDATEDDVKETEHDSGNEKPRKARRSRSPKRDH